MGRDLLYHHSASELNAELEALVAQDQRALPPKAKVFSAVAKLQGFDAFPSVVDTQQLNAFILSGGIEIQRGISSNSESDAIKFASELASGRMFPGLNPVMGHGIYFATPSEKNLSENSSDFPSLSRLAVDYASRVPPGIIVRCAISPSSNMLEYDELRQLLREERNRAKEVGIVDFGTFAAARGFDAYFEPNSLPEINETVYVVLNRGAIQLQRMLLPRA